MAARLQPPSRRAGRHALFVLPQLLAIVGMTASTRVAYQHQPPQQPPRSPLPGASRPRPEAAPSSAPVARRAAGVGESSRGGFLWGLGGAVAAAAAAATAAPRAAQALVDVGLRKEYVDPAEFFSISYPVGWYTSRRDTASTSNPAFMDKPSATLLVVADYSTGATASVTKTNLSVLVREGMGWGNLMNQFGGLGPVSRFEDILEGAGVATLLMRDRDGQLKVSALAPPRPGAMFAGDKNEPDGFLSRLVACKADGKVMDFTVKTPVNRVPMAAAQRSGGRRIKQASDVLAELQDASPIEVRPNALTPSQSTSRVAAPSTLIRQEADLRVSKAKAFLRDDGTILTVWVSADRSAWKDPDSAGSLQAILDSFDLAPR